MVRCTACGSSDIVTDNQSGSTSCLDCGLETGSDAIVSEVGFAENGQGGSSVIGQFVSSQGPRGLSATAKSGGYSRTESREMTMLNGRRRISQVAAALSLRSNHIDAASRIFNLALQRNFLQGRKTAHVVSACLYIVCRREPTPHMLLDFSEALQVNVYVLGNTFMKLSRLLNFHMPVIDPSLFIHRFAARLEFGDATHEVGMTALKLVARMKRDWMSTGRRPSGICGACLLIAARMHGFKRSLQEIVAVVRIGEQTLRRRLEEFAATPTSLLTLEEFHAQDQASTPECNPPSFTAGRARDKDKALAIEFSKSKGSAARAAVEADDDNERAVAARVASEETLEREITAYLKDEQLARAQTLLTSSSSSSAAAASGDGVTAARPMYLPPTDKTNVKKPAPSLPSSSSSDPLPDALKFMLANGGATPSDGAAAAAASSSSSSSPQKPKRERDDDDSSNDALAKKARSDSSLIPLPLASSSSSSSLSLTDSNGDEVDSKLAINHYVTARDDGTYGDDDDGVVRSDWGGDYDPSTDNINTLDDLDDDELDSFVLTKAQSQFKEKVWLELNKDYLEQQELKRKHEKEQIDAGLAPTRRRYSKKPAGKKAATAAQATATALAEKKLSSKINYAALENLLGETSIKKVKTETNSPASSSSSSSSSAAAAAASKAATSASAKTESSTGGDEDDAAALDDDYDYDNEQEQEQDSEFDLDKTKAALGMYTHNDNDEGLFDED